MSVLLHLHCLEPGATLPTRDAMARLRHDEVLPTQTDLNGASPVLAYPEDRLLAVLVLNILIGHAELDLLEAVEPIEPVDEGFQALFVSCERVNTLGNRFDEADAGAIIAGASSREADPFGEFDRDGLSKVFVQLTEFLKSAAGQSRPVLVTMTF